MECWWWWNTHLDAGWLILCSPHPQEYYWIPQFCTLILNIYFFVTVWRVRLKKIHFTISMETVFDKSLWQHPLYYFSSLLKLDIYVFINIVSILFLFFNKHCKINIYKKTSEPWKNIQNQYIEKQWKRIIKINCLNAW